MAGDFLPPAEKTIVRVGPDDSWLRYRDPDQVVGELLETLLSRDHHEQWLAECVRVDIHSKESIRTRAVSFSMSMMTEH